MKAATTTIIGVAAAFLIVACVVIEDRIATISSPEIASSAVTIGCTGGRDFISAATATLDPTAAALIVKGVETACALRAERQPVSATIYNDPLDSFCVETKLLAPGDASPKIRTSFNARLVETCGDRR